MKGSRLLPLSVASSALFAGCRLLGPDEAELEVSSTEMFEVTPSNGVWDDEYGRTDDPSNCSFRFSVARRGDGVVLRVFVFDDRVVADDCRPGDVSAPTWNDDSLQCYFDGDFDKSPDSREGNGPRYGGEYALAVNGAAQSDYSSRPRAFGREWSGFASIVENDEGKSGIRYSLWFSWASLGRVRPPAPDEDVTFGFNICVHDDDDGGRADRALFWRGNPSMPYRDESCFGTITLKGRKTK